MAFILSKMMNHLEGSGVKRSDSQFESKPRPLYGNRLWLGEQGWGVGIRMKGKRPSGVYCNSPSEK